MSLTGRAIATFEAAPLPDTIRRAAVWALVEGARRSLSQTPTDAEFAKRMGNFQIAEQADAANQQHYELPPTFFEPILGPRLKYSSCLYPTGRETLAQAEVLALRQTCERADLHDSQDILELGCGWGSLSLWMAQTYPAARIVSVSNSAPQRRYIEARAGVLGLTNLKVITADMNSFQIDGRFDRVVSVEMFEHMTNWRALLGRVRNWLTPDGKLFLHVFSHTASAYHFDTENPDDWVARYFFAGGIMPSHDLVRQFADLFTVEADWRWTGDHYARTARHWLTNFDNNQGQLLKVLTEVYGADARLWRRRWRLFFLATAGLFGHDGGLQWGVSHYRLRPTAQ